MIDAEELVKRLRAPMWSVEPIDIQWIAKKSADLIELQAEEIAALRHDIERHVKALCDAAEDNETLRKDAKRYRWLRFDMCERDDGQFSATEMTMPEMDAAIDAEMKEKS